MIVDNATKFVDMLKSELISSMNDKVNKIISGHCLDEKDYRASCSSYLTLKEIFENCDFLLKKMRDDEDKA